MTQWISAKSELPAKGVYVLCVDENREYGIYEIYKSTQNGKMRWIDAEGATCVATHWMPLPELPKEI